MTDLKMALSVDELHPFVHGYEGGTVVRAPAETISRWRRVMADFEDVQAEMLAAYEEARRRDDQAARVKAAEDAVEQAQARLEAIRFEEEHPPEDPASWPVARPVGHPEVRECHGREYAREQEAWEGRLEVYDAVNRRGARMGFDVAPYVCTEGHWHLGMAS